MTNRLITALPDLLFFGCLLLMWLLHTTMPIMQLVGFPFAIIGWCVVVSGVCAMVALLSQQKRKATSTNAGDAPSQLITTGAYAFTRNPYYLACAVCLLGVAVGLGSLAAFAMPIVYVLVLNFTVIPAEEAILGRTFHKSYNKYKRAVRRWV